MNAAFLYGESVFTTCKVVSGEIYEWEDHLNYLLSAVNEYYGAHKAEKGLKEKVENELKKSDFSNFTGALRVSIYSDDSILSKTFESKSNFCLKVLVTKRQIETFTKESMKLKLVKRVQDPILDEMKIASYGKEFFLKKLAMKSGADDVLFYGEGKVFETSVGNIFFRKDEKLFTPQSGIYKGLTRKKVIEENNVIERDILLDELSSFDEIFVTNSLFEKVKVEKII